MVKLIFWMLHGYDNSHFLLNVFGPPFKVLEKLFGFLPVSIVSVVLIYLIVFLIFPYFLVLFVSQKERKMKRKNYIITVDILCILFFVLYFFIEIRSWSSGIVTIPYDDWWLYSNSESYLISLIYSFFVNLRLLKKYFVDGDFGEYRKIIILAAIILFIIINIFYFLFYSII